MESQQYQQLNPLALAISAGGTVLILSLLVGLPMMGFGGMMGGYGGGMMWGYGGFGVMWIVGALIGALAGAIVAWIYNAVDARTRTPR